MIVLESQNQIIHINRTQCERRKNSCGNTLIVYTYKTVIVCAEINMHLFLFNLKQDRLDGWGRGDDGKDF